VRGAIVNNTHLPRAAELFGVPSIATRGRERLIDTAIDLFYRHGFHAVGLDRVIAEAGVTKTTFYKHFESKDDLIVAAITRRQEWETQAWNRAIRKIAGSDPRRQLLALFDVMDAWFNDPSFRGCIFLSAAAEFADPNEPAHQVAAAYKRNSRDGWRDLARQAGAADPEGFADLYTALVEGALIMRHVHGRDDAAQFMKPLVERLIAESIPLPAPTGQALTPV
jgi:AcrR family transcriptional regulator